MFLLPLSHFQALLKYRSKVNSNINSAFWDPKRLHSKYTFCKSAMSVDFIVHKIDYGLKLKTIKINMSNYAIRRYSYIYIYMSHSIEKLNRVVYIGDD